MVRNSYARGTFHSRKQRNKTTTQTVKVHAQTKKQKDEAFTFFSSSDGFSQMILTNGTTKLMTAHFAQADE